MTKTNLLDGHRRNSSTVRAAGPVGSYRSSWYLRFLWLLIPVAGFLQFVSQWKTQRSRCNIDDTTDDALSPHHQQRQQLPDDLSAISDDSCQIEYDRLTEDLLPGLTKEDLLRSKTYSGNRHRLSKFARKLRKEEFRI